MRIVTQNRQQPTRQLIAAFDKQKQSLLHCSQKSDLLSSLHNFQKTFPQNPKGTKQPRQLSTLDPQIVALTKQIIKDLVQMGNESIARLEAPSRIKESEDNSQYQVKIGLIVSGQDGAYKAAKRREELWVYIRHYVALLTFSLEEAEQTMALQTFISFMNDFLAISSEFIKKACSHRLVELDDLAPPSRNLLRAMEMCMHTFRQSCCQGSLSMLDPYFSRFTDTLKDILFVYSQEIPEADGKKQ